MRRRFFLFLIALCGLVLSQPLHALWSLNIEAEGGNAQQDKILVWGRDRINILSMEGKVFWQGKVSGLKRAFLLEDGQFVAVRGKGGRDELVFYTPKGYSFWREEVERISSIAWRGKQIAVVAGNRYLYLFTLSSRLGRLKGWRRYRFGDDIRDVVILVDGRICLALNQSLCLFRPPSQMYFFPYAGIQRIYPLTDGGFLLFHSSDRTYLSRHTPQGYLLWSKVFEGRGDFVLSYSPFYCLGLRQESKGGMEERELLVVDWRGEVKWKRGGVLLQVKPLLVLPNGGVLGHDESHGKLLLFNDRGRFIWEEEHPQKIKRCIPCAPDEVLFISQNGLKMMEVNLPGK